MKKFFFVVYLLFAQTVFADGIIENLPLYLKNCPECVDALGWVTVPRKVLLSNISHFDINCQYKLIHDDCTTAFPVFMTELDFTFKSSTRNRLLQINFSNKIQVWKCRDDEINIKEDVSTDWYINSIKQLSPESIKFIEEQRIERIKKQVFLFILSLDINKTSSEVKKVSSTYKETSGIDAIKTIDLLIQKISQL